MSDLPSMGNPASIGELPSRSANVQALPLLLRVKSTALRNRIHQTVDEAPIRVSVAVFLVAVIWYGLYVLFRTVFSQLERTPLEATVAIPLIFNFFFIAILALLILSNAIILYGALFGHQESSFLLTLPLHPQDLVCPADRRLRRWRIGARDYAPAWSERPARASPEALAATV